MNIKDLVNSIGVKIRLDREARKHDKNLSTDALRVLYKSVADEKCNLINYFKHCKYVKTADDLQAVYGRKWKANVEKLWKLCQFAEDYQGECDETTGLKSISDVCVIGLPQTCKELQRLFGSQQNVSNTIKKAIDAGLLAVVYDNYQIGQCSKLYAINPRKIAELNRLVNETGLNAGNGNDNIYTPLPTYSTNIRFSSGRRLPGVGVTDETIIKVLHENYPHLKFFEDLNEANNRQLLNIYTNPLPTYSTNIRFLLGKFEPKVKRNFKTGVITAISIRETSQAAVLPKKDGNFTRSDLFDYLYESQDVYEFDVKSSIYRVTYFLNTGKWLDNDVDFYQLISPYKFSTTEDRENFKAVCQRFYFAKSPEQVFERLFKKKYIEKTEENARHITAIFYNLRKTIGKTYDSEIFLHESCIYMLLMRELLKRGIVVTQVYDGFYAPQEIAGLCTELLPACAAEYYSMIHGRERIKNTIKQFLGEDLYKSEDDGCKDFVEHVERKMSRRHEEPLDCVDDTFNWTPPAIY